MVDMGRSSSKLSLHLRNLIGSGSVMSGTFLPTVRALSQTHGLALKTVQRALKALEIEGLIASEPRQGYRVMARANDPQQGGTVAFLLSETEDATRWESRHQLVLMAIQKAAAQRGWSFLALSSRGRTPEVLVEQLQQSRTFGAVVDTVEKPFLDLVRKIGLPVVLLDVLTEYQGLDEVARDEFHGGYLAAQYLLERGHQRIGWFGPLGSNQNTPARFGGAMGALLRAGRDLPAQQRFEATGAEAKQQAHRFLAQPGRPKAVLALWRSVALDLAQVALERGLRLGQDLDLVGWCPQEQFEAEYRALCPELSASTATVTWRMQRNVQAALDRLAERRLNPGQDPVRIHIPMELRRPQE